VDEISVEFYSIVCHLPSLPLLPRRMNIFFSARATENKSALARPTK
jgi:hypothetical protein